MSHRILAAAVFAPLTASAAVAEEISPEQARAVLSDLAGEWNAHLEGLNLATREKFELEFKRHCFPAANPELLVCESYYPSSTTHDVHVILPSENLMTISYAGFSKPITHEFKIVEFVENGEGWRLVVEGVGLFGGKELDRRRIYVNKSDEITAGVYDRPAGASEERTHTRTVTLKP